VILEAMSRQNVELVRRLNEVYNERGFEGDSRDLFDPEFVWDMSRMEVPESVSYSGLPGLRNFLDTWNDGFAAEHVEVEEITDAGDQVVVAIHHTGRGRASGIEVDQRYAMIWTVRAGRAVRMDMYPTREQALQAAELFKVDPEAPPGKPNQDEPVLEPQAISPRSRRSPGSESACKSGA